jgi:hypothetical protein
MSDDEIDTEIEEGYDEFIKEYGSRYILGKCIMNRYKKNLSFLPERSETKNTFIPINL